MAPSISDLITTLGQSRLLRSAQLQELDQHLRLRFAEPKALLQALVESGWLTAYQVRSVVQGQASRLTFGPYVIVDLLGEGGMGQVFKARHQSLDRVVALKVLRPECVTDDETVRRFYREIKAVSQLPPHPHLVRAFDAGPLGPTHFLAMEYMDGTDLHALVQHGEPLSVARAREFIRQAALGLQHIHEHGLVHRDIKPSNLLLTSSGGSPAEEPGPKSPGAGLVKIVDLGLARLQATDKGSARENTFLTAYGTVMLGTIDYQAPERALDFHRADIRADIYSLGCTFYYLLTGKPPFGSGPLAIKLMRHQQAEAPNLQELRSDVPDELAAIVRRMLAKRPAGRYQTPGELAEVLAAPGRRMVPAGWVGMKTLVALGATVRCGIGCRRWSWERARRHPRLALSCLALLVLALSVLFFARRQDEPSSASPAGAALKSFRVKKELHLAGVVELRQMLLQIHFEYPDTPEALAAAEELTKLPSPLDQLDPRTIPAGVRFTGAPKELVAVLGKSGQKRVLSVAFSPDGALLACGDEDKQIHLWDTKTGQERARLSGHSAGVHSVAFSPDGKTLASTGGDVRLWDVALAKEDAILKPAWNLQPVCLAYSPDGKTLAVAYGGVLKLWDTATRRERSSQKGLSDLVFSLAYSPDGRTVAVASYQLPVKVWNAADGAERSPIDVQNAYCLGYAAGGRTLAVLGPEPNPKIRLWDDANNQERSSVALPHRFERLAVAPDGSKAVTTSTAGGVVLWSLPAGAKLHQWKLPVTGPIHYHLTFVPGFAPDGRHLAVAGDNGKVYIFRLAHAERGK
jgi:eukaryotic-like serine/threonine-protein kinase